MAELTGACLPASVGPEDSSPLVPPDQGPQARRRGILSRDRNKAATEFSSP